MRSEMCSLHLTHPSAHTWSSGQPTVQRPGSGRGLPVGAGIRTHNLGLPRVSSPTLYPLGQRLPTRPHSCTSSRIDVINCDRFLRSAKFNEYRSSHKMWLLADTDLRPIDRSIPTPHTASNWSAWLSSQKEASSKDDAQESSLLKTSRLRSWITGTMSCGLIRLRYIYLVQMVSSVCGGNQVRSTKTIVSCLQSSMVMGVSWSLGSYSSLREPSEPILPIRRIRKLRRAPETPGGPLTLKYFFWIVFEFGKWLWKHKW